MKKRNSIKKDVIDLTKVQIGLTAGTVAVGSVGGSTAPFVTVGKHIPVIANIKAASHTVRMLKSLHPKRKKRRRWNKW